MKVVYCLISSSFNCEKYPGMDHTSDKNIKCKLDKR